MFGDIGAGADFFHGTDVVIGQKRKTQIRRYHRITVNHMGNIAREFDDKFRHKVTGRRLATNQHAAWHQMLCMPLLDLMVKMNNMQNIE